MSGAPQRTFLVFTTLTLIWVTTSRVAAQTANPAPAGKPQNILLNADSSTRDSDRETAELEGHVQVIYRDQHLSADHAVVNLRSKTVDAWGNVAIISPKATVGGRRVVMDLETNTGVIYQGYVQSASVSFEGRILYRTSETEFLAEDAHYTTCTTCPEAWSFAGTTIRAQLGGYAYIKNSVFEFGGFPIIYLPYLIVPLKSDRQSGLLTPEFERSNVGGLGISESFFWAMSREQDATITAKNYELRGPKGLLNYRYSINDHSGGDLDTAYLQDQAFARDPRFTTFLAPGTSQALVNRWFLRYNHYQDLPDNYVHRVQLNTASDLQYPKDFPLETSNNGDPAMEDRMSFSHGSENFFWMVDSSYYTNLLQSNPQAGNNNAVHRLPEIHFDQALTRIGDSEFFFNWSTDYTNFTRNGFGFDSLNQGYTTTGNRFLQNSGTSANCNTIAWESDPTCVAIHNGTFQSGTDLIRTGTRADGNLAVQRPIKAGKVDLLPSVSYRETDYEFNTGTQNTASRKYLRGDVSARTVFSRVFDLEGKDRIKHEIVPEVSFSNVFWYSQPDNPFFGANAQTSPFSLQNNVSDLDLNSPYGLQFDYFDRTYDRKIATFGVSNHLIRKTYKDNEASYLQFFNWKVSQSYNIYQAEGNPPYQPYSDILSELTFILDRFTVSQRYDYFPYQSLNNSSTKVRLLDEKRDFIQLGYDLSYNIVPGQPVLASARTEQYSFTVKKSLRLLDLLGKIIYDSNPQTTTGGLWINSYGIAAQFRLPGDCLYFRLVLYRPPGGTENLYFNFDFSFDGNPRKGFSEDMLSQFSF